MPYIIHNCVYKIIDAIKGQQNTEASHDTKKTIKEIKKRFSGKKERIPQKTRLYMKMELKDGIKDFGAGMYIPGDNSTQIALANQQSDHFHMVKGHNGSRQAFLLLLVTVSWQK